MPEYTKNLGLIKPRDEEFYNVQHFDGNMDIIDEAIDKKGNEIDEVRYAITIPKLIYTTKNGVDTFPIKPYSMYFLADIQEIQYDTPDNERWCINILKTFETEKERVAYEKPIVGYWYLVHETNELYWYKNDLDNCGWKIVTMNDLLRHAITIPERKVNLDLTHEEILSDERQRVIYDMFISKDTKQFMIDLVTTYAVFEPHPKDGVCMVSDESYEIYNNEAERLAVDTDGKTEIITSYVKDTNKFWFWYPTTGKWEYLSQSRIISVAVKAWAKVIKYDGISSQPAKQSVVPESSESAELKAHIDDPNAHQNITVDGGII